MPSSGIIKPQIIINVAMAFSYSQAVAFLEGLETPEEWRLERMRLLARKAEINFSRLRFVHVTGSNGKGSVCAMLYSILRQAGFSTGCYTSPHLVDWRERFLLDGKLISQKEFARLLERIMPAVAATKASQFEALTAMALLWFSERKPDWVVWEVGLGGRLDATNVVNAKFAAITSISLEHTERLGKTVEKIAWEKSKVIKPGAFVVTCNSGPALKVIEKECREKNARLVKTRTPLRVACSASGTKFVYRGKTWKASLLGLHQAENAAIAIELAKAMGLRSSAIASGVANAKWPGRMQMLSKKPLVVLDGAHNPAGIEALANSFQKIFGPHPVLVVGVMKDKDWLKMAAILQRKLKPSAVIATQPKGGRSLDAGVLALRFKKLGSKAFAEKHVEKAVEIAMQTAVEEKKGVLVCGSLYTVGEILAR
ncbi:MAG: folylpolyglutamate synthase/dihydrofolate synthase family protein [Candidatus Norongarragalinales archaeon]